MAQRMPILFHVDPADPRAPSQAAWDRMTPDERERVVAMLPAQVPEELMPPEGDFHGNARAGARQTLGGFFRRAGRRVYVSGEMNVYYPGERRFAADVFAVLDVEPHERQRWVVSHEGRGLDFVLEIHAEGDRDKDYRFNVERYARLGIPEYFIFDCLEPQLVGYRLPAGRRAPRVYAPVVADGGRFSSQVLGLALAVQGKRLRFLHGADVLPDAEELIEALGRRVEDLAARRRGDADRADAEARRRAELEAEVARLREELARLKGGGAA